MLSKSIRRYSLAPMFMISLGACVSPGNDGMRLGSDPHAGDVLLLEPGAYAADSFTFDKPMRSRPANDYVYYFKHCELLSRKPFYWQSEYGCTPPP